MASSKPLLRFDDRGIFCEVGNVYLDPWKPVENAIITHGHSDHARWGHANYITHHHNVPILKHRLGDIRVAGVEWGETFTVNGVIFSLHPAGHIVGSSQIRVEHKGEVWVFSGDYKTEDDGLSGKFEPIKCHSFITECTFGLPAFNWLPQQQTFEDINQWWQENRSEGKTSVIFGYTLGKAQRIIANLDPSIGKIFTHGAIENMNQVIRSITALQPTELVKPDTRKEDFTGNIVVAPPSAHGSAWLRKMAPYETATASGWMAFRGARTRRAVDKGFVLSDHCDWYGLLASIKATGCEKVIATHGYSDIFSRYLRELGYDARTASTQFEGEASELNTSEEISAQQPGVLSTFQAEKSSTEKSIRTLLK